ncbi:MAG: hypothetical protein ACOX5R_08515 [bacterium]|jgi:tetratricopeptide (TPR) repeat protein
MRKGTFISLALFVLFVVAVIWAQGKIIDERRVYRVEEKILMLSDRPEVTKALSLGFRGALADLLWIRSIQYFGGNFSSLHQPEKRRGLENLFNTMFELDPHFIEAFQFAGFVTNESIKDPDLAISYLLRGADHNPESWKLPFDAGFTAFYQLEDYEAAKQLFIRASYGLPYRNVAVAQDQGVMEGYDAIALVDEDSYSEVKFQPGQGSVVLDLGEVKTIGRLSIEPYSLTNQSFQLSHATDLNQAFEVISSVTQTGFYEQALGELSTRYVKIDQMQSLEEDQLFTISEVSFRGPRNNDVPSYVDRMAIEMDRSSGRFSAAWNQYMRYYDEAVQKGDEVSAKLAMDKLEGIYQAKAFEIITEAVQLYKQETDQLPSTNMNELVAQGYVQRVIAQKMGEDENFAMEVYPVLFPTDNAYQVLHSLQGEPYLLMTFTDAEGVEDWYLATRSQLMEQQQAMLQKLQMYVDKYKEEVGTLPGSLKDLTQFSDRWFTESETIFDDPLRGEFVLNQETGSVEAINPQI